MAEDKPFIVAGIPAYNEERSIARVIVKAMNYVDKVIVCDDGSTDMTGEIAERLGAEVIRHERNMGYGAALASLFRRAREADADVLVVLDADGQHDPDDIPRLVKPVLDGECDIVCGSRFLSEKNDMPGYRRWGINRITRLANLTSYEGITDAQSGFRAYGWKAIRAIMPVEQGMGASVEILMKAKDAGLRMKELSVKVDYDVEEPSSHNPLYHGVDVVMSIVKHLSIRHPLIFYGIPGFLALVVAVFFWVWTLQSFAATRQVITNVALIAIGATIVGLMLLTTSIILWVLVSVIRERE